MGRFSVKSNTLSGAKEGSRINVRRSRVTACAALEPTFPESGVSEWANDGSGAPLGASRLPDPGPGGAKRRAGRTLKHFRSQWAAGMGRRIPDALRGPRRDALVRRSAAQTHPRCVLQPATASLMHPRSPAGVLRHPDPGPGDAKRRARRPAFYLCALL